MKREQLPLHALALAVFMVGLALAGVPVGALVVLLFVLACPLMMFLMMRGMDHGGSPRTHDAERERGRGQGDRSSDSQGITSQPWVGRSRPDSFPSQTIRR